MANRILVNYVSVTAAMWRFANGMADQGGITRRRNERYDCQRNVLQPHVPSSMNKTQAAWGEEEDDYDDDDDEENKNVWYKSKSKKKKK